HTPAAPLRESDVKHVKSRENPVAGTRELGQCAWDDQAVSPEDPDTDLTKATQRLGEAFLRYVLSMPDGQSVQQADLTASQHAVVNFLAHQVRPEGPNETDALDVYLRVAGLSNLVPEVGMSLVNALRASTGGNIEVADATGDDVADAIVS